MWKLKLLSNAAGKINRFVSTWKGKRVNIVCTREARKKKKTTREHWSFSPAYWSDAANTPGPGLSRPWVSRRTSGPVSLSRASGSDREQRGSTEAAAEFYDRPRQSMLLIRDSNWSINVRLVGAGVIVKSGQVQFAEPLVLRCLKHKLISISFGTWQMSSLLNSAYFIFMTCQRI